MYFYFIIIQFDFLCIKAYHVVDVNNMIIENLFCNLNGYLYKL